MTACHANAKVDISLKKVVKSNAALIIRLNDTKEGLEKHDIFDGQKKIPIKRLKLKIATFSQLCIFTHFDTNSVSISNVQLNHK